MDTESIGELPKNSEPSNRLPETSEPLPDNSVVANNESASNDEARKEQLRASLENAKWEGEAQNSVTESKNAVAKIPLPNLNTPISETRPSLVQKTKNVLKDTRIQGLTRVVGGSVGVMAATSIASVLSGVSAIDHLTMPLAYGFIVFESYRSLLNGGVRLGEYSNLHREVQFKPTITPIGKVRGGEMIGTIHLMRSMGKMSDLSARERAVALPLDGLKGLLSLSDKFKDGSKDVTGITALKASSHLVAQNGELFTELGFALQEQTKMEKTGRANDVAGKLVITPFWGYKTNVKR